MMKNENQTIRWLALWVLACVTCLPWQDAHAQVGTVAGRYSITVGESKIIDLSFPIEGFSAVNRELISAVRLDDRRLQIAGVKPGQTDVTIVGAGRTEIYAITVTENIKSVKTALERDLDELEQLEFTINAGRVVIKGTVNDFDEWRMLQTVVPLYGDQVLNLSRFKPAAGLMIEFQSALRQMGFDVVSGTQPLEVGQVRTTFSSGTLFVEGKFYTGDELGKIRQLVTVNPRLVLVEQVRDDAGGDPRVPVVLNVSNEEVMLEVEVAFVGVSNSDYTQAGVNLMKQGLLAIDTTSAAFQGTLGKDSSSGFTGGYTVASGLGGTLNAFRGTGSGTITERAFLSFTNGSNDWKTYHNGGTLKVRVASDNAVGLEDVEYGLIMRVRGGLRDATNTTLHVNLEFSNPIPNGPDYDLKRNAISTSIQIPLGYTYVVGGMNGLMQQTGKDGVPLLRDIPLVKWLFSEKNEARSDSSMIILINPRLADTPEPRSMAPDAGRPSPAPILSPLLEEAGTNRKVNAIR